MSKDCDEKPKISEPRQVKVVETMHWSEDSADPAVLAREVKRLRRLLEVIGKAAGVGATMVEVHLDLDGSRMRFDACVAGSHDMERRILNALVVFLDTNGAGSMRKAVAELTLRACLDFVKSKGLADELHAYIQDIGPATVGPDAGDEGGGE